MAHRNEVKHNYILMTEKDQEVNDQAEDLNPEVNEETQAVEAETSPEEITSEETPEETKVEEETPEEAPAELSGRGGGCLGTGRARKYGGVAVVKAWAGKAP